jgi:inhibitor of the pro-sigma K processing machinery
MDLSQKAAVGLLAAFLIVGLLRVFKTPLKLAMKLLVNTLLGFLALWVVNVTALYTGIQLGLNLWNALTIGILGVPGLALLLLTQWVL